MASTDDYEQTSARIYRQDWRAVIRLQMDYQAELNRKPSMAEIIHMAVVMLEKSRAC